MFRLRPKTHAKDFPSVHDQIHTVTTHSLYRVGQKLFDSVRSRLLRILHMAHRISHLDNSSEKTRTVQNLTKPRRREKTVRCNARVSNFTAAQTLLQPRKSLHYAKKHRLSKPFAPRFGQLLGMRLRQAPVLRSSSSTRCVREST